MPISNLRSTFSPRNAMYATGIFVGTPALSLLCYLLGRGTVLSFFKQTAVSNEMTPKDLIPISLSPLFLTVIYLGSKNGGLLPTLLEKAKEQPKVSTIGKLAAAIALLIVPTFAVLATLTNLDSISENSWKSFASRTAINFGLKCLGILEASFFLFVLFATNRSYERFPNKKDRMQTFELSEITARSDDDTVVSSATAPAPQLQSQPPRVVEPNGDRSTLVDEGSSVRDRQTARRTSPTIQAQSISLFPRDSETPPPPPPGTPPTNAIDFTTAIDFIESSAAAPAGLGRR